MFTFLNHMSEEKNIYKTKEKCIDTYSYVGWLNSDRFLKRAFAVLGYYFVAALLVYLTILFIILLILIIVLIVNEI